DLVAHEPVEYPAGLLRVDLLVVELAGMLEGLLDRPFGDLVEDHPADLLACPGAQLLGQVPADGLALAVGVGGQVDRAGIAGRRFQLLHHLLAGGQDLVLGLEALLHVDAEPLLGQVADVPHGGLHLEVPPEVLVDRLRLGRRLDDDEVLGHYDNASRNYSTRLVTYPRTNSPPGSRRT